MAHELDLSQMTMVSGSRFGFLPTERGDGRWTCRACAQQRSVTEAYLVRIFDPTIGNGAEYPVLICGDCRRRLRSDRRNRVRHGEPRATRARALSRG